jgi:hypothetical protein
MEPKSHVGISATTATRPVTYVGEGLVVRSSQEARAQNLNGNRNFSGRFNINIEAMSEALEKQGRKDAQLLKQ